METTNKRILRDTVPISLSVAYSQDIPYRSKRDIKELLASYRKTKRYLEATNKSAKILNKLYEINLLFPEKINDNLIKIAADPQMLLSAFDKLKTNKGSMTKGTNLDTADKVSYSDIEDISKKILNNQYIWEPIRRVYIPKPGKTKKRPLGIPNFKDRILQENIRVILNALYEPSFQKLEVNFGFRPKRSVSDAIRKIHCDRQGMTTAIEGDIKGAYDNVNQSILTNILRKKIKDKKLLKLISSGFSSGLLENKKFFNTLTGVPQGGVASPILFNIYMHEFDLFITKHLTEYFADRNEKELRSPEKNDSRHYDKVRININNVKRKLKNLKKTYVEVVKDNKKVTAKIYEDKTKYLIIRSDLRKKLSIKRSLKSNSQAKTSLRFSYTRYADDWIIFTNADVNTCIEIKNSIKNWLQSNLCLELEEEKTLITDLQLNPAKFLGFRFHSPKTKERKVTKVWYKNLQKFVKRSTNVGFATNIDHDRARQRLISEGIIDKELKPIHAKKYINLKPWEIVEKFKQKIMGLYNFYYDNLTYKSELSFYYYVLKYSCIKTLAHIKKRSQKNILMTYGNNLTIPYNVSLINKKGEIIYKSKEQSMISYKDLMTWCQRLYITNIESHLHKSITKTPKDLTHINAVKNRNRFVDDIEFQDILVSLRIPPDPFTTTNINLRSGFQLQKWCCICGSVQNIQSHHLKHIKKGKISGFSLIMKALNRKTIPCCILCHQKIHRGEYDGLALRDFFDPVLAEL